MSDEHSEKKRAKPQTAEKKLANALMLLRSLGVQFRMQAPKGSPITDFISDEAKVVIELDPIEVPDERQAQFTATRKQVLEARGYRYLRVWTNDVLRNTPQIIAQIIAVVRAQRDRAHDEAASKIPTDELSDPDPSTSDLAARKTALLG